MKEVKYNLQFMSDWSCGSGLDAGVESDVLPIKDAKGLPFVPGKTIKGILREAAEEINEVRSNQYAAQIDALFGVGADARDEGGQQGQAFFSDVVLPQKEAEEICSNGLQEQLFRRISFTAIQPNGIVKPHTLRTFEFCMPLTLKGSVWLYVEDEAVKTLLHQAFKWVRYIGIGKNRGFGRCIIST